MDPTAGLPRFFTLQEANALLPRVRSLLQVIQVRAEQLAELQTRLGSFQERKRRGEHAAGESSVVQAALGEAQRIGGEIQAAFEALQALGCEVKDVQLGLVDFPTWRDGRTIYLCWRLGEDEIRFWHETDAGFAGRQPL